MISMIGLKFNLFDRLSLNTPLSILNLLKLFWENMTQPLTLKLILGKVQQKLVVS